MQTALLTMKPAIDLLWQRAARRECIEYGEHGMEIETADDGRERCFNCGEVL